jgi:hypothetical protein
MYQSTVKKLFAVVFFVLGVASVSTAQQGGAAGASDYAGFQRFPGSDISDYREEPRAIYNLALGRMQRVDGRVVPSNDERLQGSLTRITYEVPSGFTAEEVYQYWLTSC